MSQSGKSREPPRLTFIVEDREAVAQAAGELVAVQVYRELSRRNDLLRVAGCAIIGNCSNGSCNIIGNCSSSSKEVFLSRKPK